MGVLKGSPNQLLAEAEEAHWRELSVPTSSTASISFQPGTRVVSSSMRMVSLRVPLGTGMLCSMRAESAGAVPSQSVRSVPLGRRAMTRATAPGLKLSWILISRISTDLGKESLSHSRPPSWLEGAHAVERSACSVVSGGPAAWPGLHDGPRGWLAPMAVAAAMRLVLRLRASSGERETLVPEEGSASVRVPSAAGVMVGRAERDGEGGRSLGSVVVRVGMGGVAAGMGAGAETTALAGGGGGGAAEGWGRASRERPRPNRRPAAAERRRDFMA